MARYTYNAGLVTQTIDTLYAACDCLDSTNVDIKKGIEMIYNARGSENINLEDGFGIITSYQSTTIEYIETMATEIQKKAQEIEEYQNAPWYKKVFATIGLAALKVVEGLATFVEQIGDGVVSIGGFIGGIFSSEFKDCCAEFVKKDHVGDAFSEAYENGLLKSINKYSVMSHESTGANFFKGIGVATGYLILSVATAGAGTAVSLGVSTAAAGLGGIGSGTQSGLQAGMTFNQAFGKGVKQGVTAAATTLVIGGVANKLTAGARATNALSSMDDLSSAANSTKNAMNTFKVLANSSDEMAGLADDVANLAQYADEVAGLADDAVSMGGTSIKNANNTFKATKDLVKQAKNLKTAATAAGASDDIINSLDDVIAQADKAAKIAKTTKSAVAAAQGTNAVTSEGNKVTNAIANSKAGQAVTNLTTKAANSKAGQIVTSLATKAANSKVGQIATKLATKAGPVTTNAIAATSGTLKGGMASAPLADATFKQMYEEATTVTEGQQLASDAATALDGNLPSAVISEQEATSNLEKLQSQGYNPGSGSATQTTTTAGANTQTTTTAGTNTQTGTTSSGGTGVGNRYTVTTDPVELPSYPKGNTGTTSSGGTGGGSGYKVTTDPVEPPSYPSGNTGTNTIDKTTDQNTIVSGINPVNPGPGGTGGAYVSNGTGAPSSGVSAVTEGINATLDEAVTETVGSEVLDTFGNVSGSLSEISGSNVSIPTSSSPILNSGDGKSSTTSFIPLGAGLGAASLAGIGTKAYLDKREKEKETESDEIETEEWSEKDNIEIDYGVENSEETDYLSPTDELAFTE